MESFLKIIVFCFWLIGAIWALKKSRDFTQNQDFPLRKGALVAAIKGYWRDLPNKGFSVRKGALFTLILAMSVQYSIWLLEFVNTWIKATFYCQKAGIVIHLDLQELEKSLAQRVGNSSYSPSTIQTPNGEYEYERPMGIRSLVRYKNNKYQVKNLNIFDYLYYEPNINQTVFREFSVYPSFDDTSFLSSFNIFRLLEGALPVCEYNGLKEYF